MLVIERYDNGDRIMLYWLWNDGIIRIELCYADYRMVV